MRGAQCPGREHEVTRLHARLGPIGVLDKAHHVPLVVGPGFEALHLRQGPYLGTGPDSQGEVVVVERVLRPHVATDVALTTQTTRLAVAVVQVAYCLLDGLPRDGPPPLVREGDGQLGQEPLFALGVDAVPGRRLVADRRGGRPECCGLRHRRVGGDVKGEDLGSEGPLDGVVVGLQVGPRDRPPTRGPVDLGVEPALVLADEDVGVDQRPTAETRRDDGVDVGEGAHIEEAEAPASRVPEVAGESVGRSRERTGWIGGATLEHEHVQPGLGEPHRGHGSAEARTHDHHVECLHGTPSRSPRTETARMMHCRRHTGTRLTSRSRGVQAGHSLGEDVSRVRRGRASTRRWP